MRTLWFVIYNIIGIPAIWLFFSLYSIFNSKVREGLRDRRDLFTKLNKSLSVLKSSRKVLIHCSSLGEFQQAIPLAEELAKKNYGTVMSFFSPSGFNNSKINFPETIKTYLPLDSLSNEKKLLDTINPEIIIFMRYDLWFNLLYESGKRGIKTVVANARYDEKDITWNFPVASSFKKTLYGMIDTIFVIDKFDEKNYRKKLAGLNTNVIKIGDSKFERVYDSMKNFSGENVLPEKITKGKKIFIIGSSWKEDEEVLLPAIDKTLRYEPDLLTIIVPHEPKETKLDVIEKKIESKYPTLRSIRYSKLDSFSKQNVIIVDKIGILSKLYSTAYMSYVGGGFKTGLHNILEPAIFNMPVLFSNDVKNSDEDEILLKYGCGIRVRDTRQFYRLFREILKDENLRNDIGKRCHLVFRDNVNVSEKIINNITSESK